MTRNWRLIVSTLITIYKKQIPTNHTKQRTTILGMMIWRCNLDNKAREDIIRVMNMRIILNNKSIITLITNCVKCLTFTNHIDFVAWFGQKIVTLYDVVILMIILNHRTISVNGKKYERNKKNSTIPWSCISYGFWA